jgi:hypothetical protein
MFFFLPTFIEEEIRKAISRPTAIIGFWHAVGPAWLWLMLRGRWLDGELYKDSKGFIDEGGS